VRNLLLRAAACAAVLACGTLAQAHEIGTTRVSALFGDDHRYDIEIVTDAASLVEKLETLAGSGRAVFPGTELTPVDLADRLVALDEVFRQRVMVAFDGAADRPAVQYAVSPPVDAVSPPIATIRLSGDIPRGARHFTWTYAWTFASYALSVRTMDAGHPVTE
jgi:hypothetical protein